jgi:ATP-binding cassette subfamily C protein/ATP-binding cassette subfamily C protein LapB
MVCATDEEPVWEVAYERRGRLIRLEKFDQSQGALTISSISEVTSSFRGLFPWLIFATFMSNLTGLATPLLIMVIYDRVIPSGSVELVISLTFVVAVFLATDAGFRAARSSALAHMGRETEQRSGLALFRKLMALPVEQIQKSNVEQQLARFKQFEGFRDVFTGQVLTTLLDLPFTLIFFGFLFWLSPQVGLLILGLSIIFLIAGWYFFPAQQKYGSVASKHRSALQAHVFETATHQRAIQRLGLEAHWFEKQSFLTEQATQATRTSNASHQFSQNVSQSLMSVAGVGAVCIGTLSAMAGDISFGALIAILSLVWKILTPMQALYSNMPQIFGYLRSKEQSDRVLAIPEELVRGVAQSHQKSFSGKVSFSGVTHRYDTSAIPALSQVSLDIAANDFAVICGEETSGKTTMLDLLCGFYQPTIGTIKLDEVDIRQVPVDDLRRSVTYAQPDLFYGTIFQNFRLAAPSLSESNVEDALRDMSLEAVVASFPEGIHTRLSEAFRSSLPTSTLRALALARSFARGGSVLLLNEPTHNLDAERCQALLNCLNREAGKRTLIVASQDLNIIKHANRFVFLDQGRVVLNDTGETAAKKLNAYINRSRGN